MPQRVRVTYSYDYGSSPAVYKDSYYPAGPNGMSTPYSTTLFFGGSWQGWEKTMVDHVTPNFRKRMHQGEVIINSLDLFVRERSGQVDTVWDTGVIPSTNGTGDWGRLVMRGDILGMISEKAFTFDNAESKKISQDALQSTAVTAAYANLNSSTTKALVSVKELDSTLKMLRSPLKGARKTLLRMFKEKQKRTLGKSLADCVKIADEIYLEHKYGWKNTISDMVNVMVSVHKARARMESERRVVRGSASASVSWKKDFDQSGFGGWPTLRARGHVDHNIDQRVDAGIVYALPCATTTQALAEEFGVGAKDLLSSVYETLPWSFVVDWFIGIGDWLSAIAPNPFVQVLGSWATYTEKNWRIISDPTLGLSVTSLPALPTTLFEYTVPGTVRDGGDSVIRVANPALPSTPTWKPKVASMSHTIDGLALSSQQLVKMMSRFR